MHGAACQSENANVPLARLCRFQKIPGEGIIHMQAIQSPAGVEADPAVHPRSKRTVSPSITSMGAKAEHGSDQRRECEGAYWFDWRRNGIAGGHRLAISHGAECRRSIFGVYLVPPLWLRDRLIDMRDLVQVAEHVHNDG
jgi:hypothetical protein